MSRLLQCFAELFVRDRSIPSCIEFLKDFAQDANFFARGFVCHDHECHFLQFGIPGISYHGRPGHGFFFGLWSSRRCREAFVQPRTRQGLGSICAFVRIKHEQFFNEIFGLIRDAFPSPSSEIELTIKDLFNNVSSFPSIKWHLTTQQHVGNDSDAPDISLFGVISFQNFGCHGVDGPDTFRQLQIIAVHFGQSKIDQFNFRFG
mmetsp:Transcript_14486/g.23515  ORF Transcript_14486/g.23515 Transcript_14486/m.23515 type:complete len:204 (+) Transcript_14486:918-1529(+)